MVKLLSILIIVLFVTVFSSCWLFSYATVGAPCQSQDDCDVGEICVPDGNGGGTCQKASECNCNDGTKGFVWGGPCPDGSFSCGRLDTGENCCKINPANPMPITAQ